MAILVARVESFRHFRSLRTTAAGVWVISWVHRYKSLNICFTLISNIFINIGDYALKYMYF